MDNSKIHNRRFPALGGKRVDLRLGTFEFPLIHLIAVTGKIPAFSPTHLFVDSSISSGMISHSPLTLREPSEEEIPLTEI